MKAATRMNLYLPSNLANSVKKLAEEDDRSINEYVMRILKQHVLDRLPQNKIQEPPVEIAIKTG